MEIKGVLMTENETKLLNMLKRLTEKVKKANDIQHSGEHLVSEDWSELYMLQNESFALINEIENG